VCERERERERERETVDEPWGERGKKLGCVRVSLRHRGLLSPSDSVLDFQQVSLV
jgi:hypothetical protein